MPALPTVRFDDMSQRTTTTFTGFVGEIRADNYGEVRAALDDAQRAALEGHWVGGFISYDAAQGFDEALVVAPRGAVAPPLVWFGVFTSREVRDYTPPTARQSDAVRWMASTPEERYVEQVEFIRECIRRGEVYQTNLTTRVTSENVVDRDALYHQLLDLQQPCYGAMMTVGDLAIMSASPELFFDWRDSSLRCRPMKGTQRRGRFAQEDVALATSLASSTKEQAENIMIVDLVRNDMAKVALLGTVHVSSLLEVEVYPQVLQLVSEVRCRTPRECTLYDVVAALFPCGSVTGAPKASAMSLIAHTEESPRGVYCGAVGFLSPTDTGLHARFNVAIRTAIAQGTQCQFGAGGGIVIGSEPAREYAEMLLKARQLEPIARDFELLETFRHDPRVTSDRRDRHLRRLADSARLLGFEWPSTLATIVDQRLTSLDHPARIRLRLSKDGELTIDVEDLPLDDGPVTLALDDEPINSDDAMLFIKTTRREIYERRRQRFPDADDVVMVNERGECTETTIANLMVRYGDDWFTPPLSSGCLPGIGREVVLEIMRATERVILIDDLLHAEEIAVVNSLRGWRRARLRD
jgi:para-aminobenzoate synthetase/4-amino-4-deoxychorismate lyase